MSDFWNKYDLLCKRDNVSPTKVAKEIGVSSSAVSTWKNGRIPTGDTLLSIAKHFKVSVEYLLSDDEINIRPADKKNVFISLNSLPQRWASLRHGDALSDEDINRIAAFTNSSVSFLYSDDRSEYEPVKEAGTAALKDIYILDTILGVMDRCPDSGNLRRLQIQLSHIVRYWLSNKEIGINELKNAPYRAVSNEKLDFLYGSNSIIIDSTVRYGFNFTEIDAIREASGLTFLYLFTGIEGDIGRLMSEEKNNELDELKARIAELESKL